MKATIIILAIALVVFAVINYLKKRKEKPKIIYVNTENTIKPFSYLPNLTMDEYYFYDALNIYSPNDLILDGFGSEQAKEFAKYCNTQDKRMTHHEGVGGRISALKKQGATSVSEIYVGGYRTMETGVKRLKKSPSHNRTMLKNYTHIGVAVVNKHYVAIYFNIE